jgi:cytochrome c553
MITARPGAAAPLVAVLAAATFALAGCGAAQTSTRSAQSTQTAVTAEVARGRDLYAADGCEGCHSLDGTRLTGPSWKGLAGSEVTLSNGRTLTANDAYLTRHIIEPDALTVRGYPAAVMGEAIEGLSLRSRPADVAAIVGFIDTIR